MTRRISLDAEWAGAAQREGAPIARGGDALRCLTGTTLDVLHVVQGYAPAIGGSERVIERLSEEFVRGFGDRVTVFTTDCRSAEAFPRPSLPRLAVGTETRHGVDVRRFRVLRSLGPVLAPLQKIAFRLGLPLNDHLRTLYAGPIIPGLIGAIRQHGADVIAATSFPLRHMYQALRGARTSGRPCVLIGGLHPEDRWGYDRAMIHRAIRRADLYIAYTEFEARHVVEHGADAERVEVIGVGVDAEPFVHAGAGAAALRRELGVGDAPLIGFIGQLGVHKGIALLLEAMAEVWGRRPDARLLIAGASTVYAELLRQSLDRMPLEARDRILLRLDFAEEDKPRLFAALDVLASPSEFESYGLVFLEAWAAGKPVVACRRGAVAEVVHDGSDGLLVPYGDPGALAGALLGLIGNSERARALGARGRARVLTQHGWPVVAARFRAGYLRVIRDAASRRR